MTMPNRIANTTAMPALSRGLRCNQGKELASKPMPVDYATQVRHATASRKKNRRRRNAVMPATQFTATRPHGR